MRNKESETATTSLGSERYSLGFPTLCNKNRYLVHELHHKVPMSLTRTEMQDIKPLISS